MTGPGSQSGGGRERVIKVSFNGGPQYVSALSHFEPKAGGELAGRRFFVASISEDEHVRTAAQSLTIEWQGQSIKIDL